MFGEVRHFLRLDSNLLFRSLYFVKETKALGHCVYRRTCCLKPAKISFSALSIKGESYILSFVKQRTVFYRSAMSCNETKLTERTTGGNLQSGQDIKDNSDNVENNARISSDNLYLEQELKNNDSEGRMNVEDSNVLEGPVMTLDSVTSVEHSDYPQEVGEVSSVSISDTVIAGITTSIASQCTPKIEEESIVVMKYCWTDDEGTSGKENEDSDSEQQAGADKEKGAGADGRVLGAGEKRKAEDGEPGRDLKKAKLETKALKAKRPGFTDDRYNETSYYIENGLRKVYPYYFTFTTFTKGRWVGERILDVFAREFRAHPAEEYERCIRAGTLTVNYEKVDVDYRLKHNDLLANVVHRHEVPVTSEPITIVHMDEDVVVVNKPASIPAEIVRDGKFSSFKKVHPCGRYRHNTVVFILAKEYNLRNLRTIHRLDRLTSGLLLFGRTPKKARAMEHQIRNRQVVKEYVCRVEGDFPSEVIECEQPIEVVSYKIGVCKVSPRGKHCTTTFQKLGFNGKTSVISCKPHTGRMHQIRVHLQYLGYPVVNDPLYNHTVFGPEKGRGGNIGKTDEELIRDLINIHNAENWLGMDGDSELSMFKRTDLDEAKGCSAGDEEADVGSREPSPCDEAGDGADSPSVPASVPVPAPAPTPPALPPSMPVRPPAGSKVTVATQTGQEAPDLTFNPDKLTWDEHCYECKVRYRDPKPKDLVMYLHAWKYKGPGWSYETELPDWARVDWVEQDE